MNRLFQTFLDRFATAAKLQGETKANASGVKTLIKDVDGNTLIARAVAGTALPQKKSGFAKGCILFLDASGAANQNSKALYENVGNALLSRFNTIGSVVDPEILLPHKRILLGQHNGLAKDVAITGDITISESGEVTIVTTELDLADGKIWVGGSDGKADAVTPSGVITVSNTGVVSFAPLYSYTHRVVAAGVTEGVSDADGVIRVNNWRIASADVAIATLFSADHDVSVERAQCKEGRLDIFLTAQGGANTRVNYIVMRAVGDDPSNPATTLAPTTYASTSPPLVTDEPTTLPPTTLAPTTAAPTTT